MIERYSRKVMRDIWSEKAKFQTWLDVEIAIDECWNRLGVIPDEDLKKIQQNATFDVDRIFEIEQQTRHDVIAFTRAVSESLDEEKKWIHYGITSTDVVDTANGIRYQKANEVIQEDLYQILAVLKKKALQYKNTPMMGRTHGVHAEITSFGLLFALWYEEIKRNIDRFKHARKEVEAGKISGAVGTFANIPMEIQDYVCAKFHLESAKISTQILQRDRHAMYFSTLGVIASTLEQMATEIRHLQRTEVREVEEYFNPGQKGSSAMPHKRNPIGCENICGCARVIRGYVTSSLEDVALWHQRDISHSSTERIIAVDATTLLDYMLNRLTKILDQLTVFEDRMKENIFMTHGVIFSGRVLTKLIEKGCSREFAYDTVQPIAIKAWNTQTSFQTLLEQNATICSYLSHEEIVDCFDLQYHLRSIDAIYRRVRLYD